MNLILKVLVLFFMVIQIGFSQQLNFSQEEKVYLSKNTPLIVHGHNAFPPFNYNENGNPMGYTYDYMKLMSKYSGIKFQFTKSIPWNEAIKKFQNDEIDILPHLAKTDERLEYMDYTNFNHLEYLLGITVKKNNDITSMDDLKDKVIAVVNNSFIHPFLKERYLHQKILVTPSTSDAVSLVASGKADVFIGSIPVMDFYIKKSWYNNLTTKTIEGIGLKNKIIMPMGIHKGDTLLKSILEKGNLSIPYAEIVNLKEKWIDIETVTSSDIILNREEKSYLKQKETIKICIVPNLFPFGKIDQNGKYIGIGADIMSMISEKINAKISLVPTKRWDDSLKYMQSQKCDIIPLMMKTLNHTQNMNFTKSLISEPFVVVTKLDKRFIENVSRLSNKKIGIIKDYHFKNVIQKRNPKIIVVEVNSAKEGLEKVRRGELYGYADMVSPLVHSMQENSMIDLKITGKLDFDTKLSIASRSDEPLLNGILDKALDTISKEQIDKIISKWISIKVEPKVDYTLLLQISGVFILIIFIILYKNRQISQYSERIQKNQKDLEIAQSVANMGSWILDVGKNQLIWSKQSYEIFEVDSTKKDLTADSFLEYIHPEDRKRVKESLDNSIEKKELFHVVHRLLLHNKIEKIVEAKGKASFPLDSNGVKKTIFYGTVQDITLKSKQEEELKAKEKLLVDQAKLVAMGEMIGNIAHQWRQPLSVISTGATGMKAQKKFGILSDEVFDHICDLINDNAQYLSKTIDDFKNFIKGDRTKKVFNLQENIDSFLHLVEGTIKNNNIILVQDIQKDIEINGYENELLQCLINIFNNAKDALVEKNIEQKYIFINTWQEKDMGVVQIKDNAGGIPDDIISRIFEPYFTTKHQSQGTGLGLHMTYNLILKSMKGNIEVSNVYYKYDNESYTGAEFTITLPLS